MYVIFCNRRSRIILLDQAQICRAADERANKRRHFVREIIRGNVAPRLALRPPHRPPSSIVSQPGSSSLSRSLAEGGWLHTLRSCCTRIYRMQEILRGPGNEAACHTEAAYLSSRNRLCDD